MSHQLCCLIKSGALPLTNNTRTTLFKVARNMYRLSKNRRKIRGPDAEISIRTKFESAAIAAARGIKFNATIESSKGTATIEYIVWMGYISRIAFESGLWVPISQEQIKELGDLVVPEDN